MFRFLIVFVFFLIVSPTIVHARIVLDINNAQRSLYPIAIPTSPQSAPTFTQKITDILSFNLTISGWFDVIAPDAFLADLTQEGVSIRPDHWKDTGAYGVIKHRAVIKDKRISVTFYLYEIDQGTQPVLTRHYAGPLTTLRTLTHRWSNDVLFYYTGREGFFTSRIAFTVKKPGQRFKQIYTMDFDGNYVHPITNNRNHNILPAWSPDGKYIAFTSYMRATPDLYITSRIHTRSKRLSQYNGMNTGASWSPDGHSIAITLSKHGNPEIYTIDSQTGLILKRLTTSPYNDTSPSWSPDGKYIAFVSNRTGAPHIFVMHKDGTNLRRISLEGSYNTTPTWSPNPNARILAYTTKNKHGRFNIATFNLDTNTQTIITNNQGNNEEPSFSPGGHVIAFTSSRNHEHSGIYITAVHGKGKQWLIYKGNATQADWGPNER